MIRTLAVAAVLTLATALAVPYAGAQAPTRPSTPTVASVNVGFAQWDLSGTGSDPMIAFRVDRQVFWPALLAEGSLGFLQASENAGTRSYVIPEAQLQLQLPRRIAPYIGVGGGAFSRISGGSGTTVTAAAAAGLRAWELRPGAVLRAELRVRGTGTSFSGAIAEWTVGMGWAF